MIVLAACAIPARAQAGDAYALSQTTFNGAGGVSTSVEGYELFATIGAHDAGQSGGDGYTLRGGFVPLTAAQSAIPATSQWGLVAMLLLILCAGTIVAGRHPRPARA